MTFSRTVNYTQNVPVDIAWASYMAATPPRNVIVAFDFGTTLADSKVGTIVVPETSGVTVISGQLSADDLISGQTRVSGDITAVQTALNGSKFQSLFYDIENTSQDFLTQNRTVGDHKGEMLIQINPSISHGLSVGSFLFISTTIGPATVTKQFQVTKLDSSSSANRIWSTFRGGYGTYDAYYSSGYSVVNICADTAGNATQSSPATKTYTPCYLQNSSGVNIAPIIDLAYCNPHGDISISCFVTDGTTETNTYNFNGSFFTAEPVFLTDATATVSATSADTWSSALNFGTMSQPDDNFESIQLLIKCLDNDPMYLNVTTYTNLASYPSGGTSSDQLLFIGDKINEKAALDIPRYIEDTSYGLFGKVQIGERVSATPTTGLVRWHYYDIASNCSTALSRISYFRPAANLKDFAVERRIVDGKHRIYSNRGK